MAAWAIGGTGIWVMHFVAMIGFSVQDQPVRYDLPITMASWLLAIVVVAIGLFIVGFGRPSAVKILAAGLFTGVGVASMHYTGMTAMRTSASVTYDRNLVIASVAIAVVAATVALWFTVTLSRGLALGIAALIMGVAVSGMHYTGMLALRISSTLNYGPVQGLLPVALIVPIAVFVFAGALVLLGALLQRSGHIDEADPTLRIHEPAPAPAPAARTIPTQRTSAAAFTRASPQAPRPPAAPTAEKRPRV